MVTTVKANELSALAIETHFIAVSPLGSGFLGTKISMPGVTSGFNFKMNPMVAALVQFV